MPANKELKPPFSAASALFRLNFQLSPIFRLEVT